MRISDWSSDVCSSDLEQIVDVRRDQKATSEALNALEELVRRFPDSKYARDAQLKIDLALDHLAGKHMELGRFYQGQIGRASCWERVCQYGSISVVAVSLKKKIKQNHHINNNK